MKFSLYELPTTSGNPKCTCHRNGKLGFNRVAAKVLDLNTQMYIGIGKDDEQDNSEMFMKVYSGFHANSLKVSKAGNYFYINTKTLWDILDMNYTDQKIIFDLEEVDYGGDIFYKMNQRVIERKK